MKGLLPSSRDGHRLACYGLALLVGLAFVAWLIPWWQILPRDPLGRVFDGDDAQAVIGQRYFLGEPWRWPLLRVQRLDWPDGVNVALTDCIPVLMLPLKLLRAWLPPGFFVRLAWIALAWTLQPVAAVFALRSAGERRLWPALAIAAFSLCLPTLLTRFVHVSLCTHALLLVALGLYFRIVRQPDGRHAVATSALLLVALLVHPYLLAMAAALLAAAPLTLALRRQAGWRPGVVVVAVGVAVAASLAMLLGYGGAEARLGFGVYSMNLLSPVVPGGWGLVPLTITDPTGGQSFEGYQYLGGGLLLLLGAAAVAQRTGSAVPQVRRHAGLVLVLLALTLFSLSGTVYLGGHRLTRYTHLPAAMLQFRVSGRFFWPVTYALLVWAVATCCRAWRPGVAAPLLVAALVLQVADASRLLRFDYDRARQRDVSVLDRAALAPLLADASLLTLWPLPDCGAEIVHDPATLQLLLLGSRTLVRTNTMYLARADRRRACDPAAVLGAAWRPGELRVVLPSGRAADRRWMPGFRDACWRSGSLVLCAQGAHPAAPVVESAAPPLPLGRALQPGAAPLAAALAEGWAIAGPDGVWSLGRRAVMRFSLPPSGSLVVTLTGFAVAPRAGSVQRLTVLADGRPVAEAALPDLKPARLQATVPGGTTELTLLTGAPVRPADRGINDDLRVLGFHLETVRFEPVGGADTPVAATLQRH